jgi:predicted ATPase/DNA-binding CsgD family transcriptional regulator
MSHATFAVSTRNELPRPLTSLVGRDADIAAIQTFLRHDATRLLTLIGPGGVGKTRLAIAIAQASSGEFADGIIWVSLAPVQEDSQVLPAIVRALDSRAAGSQASSELPATIVGDRQMLLILDNFEHVSDAAPELSRMLSRCPHLRLLVTSRTTLHLAGGRDYPVAPLPLPDISTPASLEELIGNDAVALFMTRAQTFRPEFRMSEHNALAVAEICSRVDGLPLAIEMAAARIRVLHPRGILARLEQRLPLLVDNARDAPSRQRTLRDTIAWSYDLLDPEEQRLFRAISVFSGGCTLDAASAVAGISEQDTLDGITTLIDNNLLQRAPSLTGDPRFRMLETIREYGLEQLVSYGEEHQVNERHAEWCVALGVRVWYEFSSKRFDRVDDDLDNVRSAFVWSVQRGDVERTLALCWILAVHWFLLGALNTDAIGSLTTVIQRFWPTGDFFEIVDRLVDEAAEPIKAETHAGMTLGGVSWLAIVRGDLPRALRIAHNILEWHGSQESVVFTGPSNQYIGIIATEMGDHELAVHHLRQALPQLRRVGDTIWTPHALYYLGLNHYHLGDLDEAATYLRASRARFQTQRQGWAESGPLTYLARIARDRGDLGDALAAHQEALTMRHHFGDRYAASSTLRSIGEILLRNGQPDAATRIIAATTGVGGSSENISTHARERFERAVNDLQTSLGPQRFENAWAIGVGLTFDAAVAEATQIELSTVSAPPSDGNGAPAGELTPRETEVLHLLARGLNHTEIANALFISPRTVSTHATNIYGKLGVNTHAAAIAYAYQHGLVRAYNGDDR